MINSDKQHGVLGLDFGTESVRALLVDAVDGREIACAVDAYEHGVITGQLPETKIDLPADFALQHAGDYIDSVRRVIRAITKTCDASSIIAIGLDFTASTLIPVDASGEPLMFKPAFANNPHAWVKLWKHHGGQAAADRLTEIAHERNEPFLPYFGGMIFSEWTLPKILETLWKAPDVYDAAHYFMEAGDWMLFRMTGSFIYNHSCAGFKGLWTAEHGFPSADYLRAVEPGLANFNDKRPQRIVAAGTEAGCVTEAFAADTGLPPGIPVSASLIDGHCGLPGAGVCTEGPVAIAMGTSCCEHNLRREMKFAEGCAGIVRDGILPGFYTYEYGQSAVGDMFGWYARTFMRKPFEALSKGAAELRPGASGLLALDWMGGNRCVLMDGHLSGMILGLTLASRPEEVYRALVEGAGFGLRVICDAYVKDLGPITHFAACGGLTKDPFIMQTFADITGIPFEVAASDQAVALGAAVFGAMAAGAERGGWDTAEDAIRHMVPPSRAVYTPHDDFKDIYGRLYSLYRVCHDYFGVDSREIMRKLRG